MQEKNTDDYWNVGGDRELSDTWTNFTRLTVLDEKPQTGFSWSGERLTRKRTTSRPDTHVWCIEMQRKAKSGLSKNRSSTMLENCVVFTSLIQVMKNSSMSWRMHVESWRFRCQLQCLARLNVISTGRPAALKISARQNTALGRISSQESWRPHCREGINSLNHYNLVHKFFLCLKQWKYQMLKQLWTKNGTNSRKCQHGSWRKVRKSKERRQTRAPCVVDGRLSRPSCTSRWHSKRWFGLFCSIHRARFIGVTNDSCKK